MSATLRRGLAALALIALAGCAGAPVAYGPAGEPIAASIPAGPYSTIGAPAPGLGYQCFAGTYVCPLGAQLPIGTQCSCPGLGAPSFGVVR